ncbi:parafibromin-like protein [Fragilaria crotonensis]|nr:parafibromin-like protein [Fragilaria crotonensis]
MALTLQEWASKGHLQSAVLSDDGKILSWDGISLQGDEIASIDQDGKSCQYSLASIFLQIRDPTQGLMPYRNASRGVSREKSELAKALSAEGFDLTPEMIQESTVDIMTTEIPVGNSNSILRPAPNRDFQRVLDLYLETENRRKAVQTTPTLQRPHLVGKKPIIVLPKGLTPPITMWNAYHLFQNSKFIPRDVLMKQGATKTSIQTLVKHKFDIRRGGHEVEFELMDNPTSQLGGNPKEWDRIVAVVSLGASWQFKDWPRGFSTPVDLFTKSFGFFHWIGG